MATEVIISIQYGYAYWGKDGIAVVSSTWVDRKTVAELFIDNAETLFPGRTYFLVERIIRRALGDNDE